MSDARAVSARCTRRAPGPSCGGRGAAGASSAAGRSALPAHLVPLFGKFLCFGIAALAMDLVWGYAGILSLGHGLFFALGGYGDGDVPDALDRRRGRLPQRRSPTSWCSSTGRSCPGTGTASSTSASRWRWRWWCRALLALVFGWFAFRSRIRGVYFSIVTQALTYAAMLLFFQNATGFGGNNGLTDFKRILGCAAARPVDASWRSTWPRRSRCWRPTCSAGSSSPAASAAC